MKKTMFKTTCLFVATLAFTLTACKKEDISQKRNSKSEKETASDKTLVYEEGIISHDGFNSRGTGSIIRGYFRFVGPSFGQQPNGSFALVNPVYSTVTGCGATTGINVYLYKSTTGVLYLDGWYGNVAIVDASGNVFTSAIEEIEIHPQTQQVYALVKQGNSIRIYIIDPLTGIATNATINTTSSIIFNNPLANGYLCGSIAFVPDGSGGSELVFSHESNVYAANGVYSWHFSTSGMNLTGLPLKSQSYTGITGTVGSGINTTYGNGNLYFARHGSSNPLYSLSLVPGSNTATSLGYSVTNTNDFGYWKAF